jgi:hypothetical protein
LVCLFSSTFLFTRYDFGLEGFYWPQRPIVSLGF